MDFFESQDVARRHTSRLVLLFVLAVLGIIVSTYLLVAGVIVAGGEGPRDVLDPGLLALIGGGTIVLVGGGSAYKLAQLRGGGRVIAEHLGGRLLVPEGADFRARRLLNVVDEMAIASGIPAPAVYLLEQEAGINAFAAGYTPDDAVIGVTRGTVERLNREQLQGVIAHEFSHLLNGDMRLNLRLIGVLHGILLLGLVGRGVLRSLRFGRLGGNRRGGKGGGGIAAVFAIALGLMIVGFVGVFFGNLIKAAVSRQREYLADASAVQFTRNPDGIAGALKVIGGAPAGSSLKAAHAAEASHMFFARGLHSGFESLFATHPPLGERIRRIEPGWDGVYPEVPREPDAGGPGGSGEDAEEAADREVDEDARAGAAAFAPGRDAARGRPGLREAGAAGAGPAPGTAAAGAAAFAERAVARVGRPTPAHVERAAQLIEALPHALRVAAREAWGARAVIFALLLHRDGPARERQLHRLDTLADPGLGEFTRQLAQDAATLPPEERLPLVDLAIPALRSLSPTQHAEFFATLDALIEADESMDLFEWALQRVLRQHLTPAQEKVGPRRLRRETLAELRGDVAVVLSALARAGASDEAAAADALQAAAAPLGLPELPLLSAERCGPAALDAALDVLVAVHPLRQRELVAACAVCVRADGRASIEEVELLRAFADALNCPLPPLLADQAAAAR